VFLMENYKAKDLGEFINIGSGIDLKIKDLAEIAKRAVGFKGKIEWDTSKPDGTPRKLLDVSRLKEKGWAPEIGLEEGVSEVYRVYLERGSA
jgi:GDP-L-fucose synthase